MKLVIVSGVMYPYDRNSKENDCTSQEKPNGGAKTNKNIQPHNKTNAGTAMIRPITQHTGTVTSITSGLLWC